MKRRLPRPRDLVPFLRPRKVEFDLTRRRLARCHTIEDLRLLGKRLTPRGPFEYVDGGADDEVGLARARQAWRQLEFRPNILRDITHTDLGVQILGRHSALPFGLAPTGFTRMVHSGGELAVLRAAASADVPYALSTVGTASLAEVAAAAPEARRWFQVYLLKDRGRSLAMLAEAARFGYEALVLTVDVPVVGNRVRDKHNGMLFPPQLTMRTFLDASRRVRWWFDLLTTEPYRFTFEDDRERAFQTFTAAAFYDQSVTFDDLVWMREQWRGPLIVKGLQTVGDAARAADHGADVIVLSNHGGRQLDRGPVPLDLLPNVVAKIGGAAEVWLDTGIRNGADIVAALALGADFTLVGRAYLYGLMAGGTLGVAKAIEILREEIARTMQLLGVNSIAELTPDHIYRGACGCSRASSRGITDAGQTRIRE